MTSHIRKAIRINVNDKTLKVSDKKMSRLESATSGSRSRHRADAERLGVGNRVSDLVSVSPEKLANVPASKLPTQCPFT